MGLAGDFGRSLVAETARVLQELDTVISSAEMKWSLGKRYKDEPNVNHYIGNHHDWQINVMDYCGGCVDGGATNAKRGLVVHLTPALAQKAMELARKATSVNTLEVEAILDAAILRAAEARIEWLPFLPKDKTEYTAREIINAIGAALTAAGIPNNLEKN